MPSVVPRHSGGTAHSRLPVQVPVLLELGADSGRLGSSHSDPGWTTQWTRPPLLHFSGFVVLGMDFHSIFIIILYIPNINLLIFILQLYDDRKR